MTLERFHLNLDREPKDPCIKGHWVHDADAWKKGAGGKG